MRVGGHFIATSITVLEQKSGPQVRIKCLILGQGPEGMPTLMRHLRCLDAVALPAQFIFGLDNLKRHQVRSEL